MSFAKKYSRDFEKLSRYLLSEQLDLPEEAIQITPATSDGGLDGKGRICIGIIMGNKLGYNFAFEAKLRGERKGAGLDIFAKSMIVAFNAGHHGLALTTNRQFSPQCVAEAARFRIRTGLEFLYVDGPRISHWVRSHFESLLLAGYLREFLEGLLWPDDLHMIYDYTKQEIVIPMDFAMEHTAGVTSLNTANPGDHLVARVDITAPPAPPEPLQLLGYERNRVFDAFKSNIESSSGLHLLWGDAGVGKSLVVRQIGQERAAAGWHVTRLDLRQTSTARELFLKTLAPLLGIDLSIALSEAGHEDAGALLRSMVGADLPDTDFNALATVLSRSYDNHKARSDLDHATLLAVFSNILERRELRSHSCPHHLLIFDEATYASPEVLDFLSKLLPLISKSNISLLLEARFYDVMAGKEKHWEAFKNVVLSCAMSQHTLPPFTRDDALAYVYQTLLPGIGEERADIIVSRVGTTPLFLESAADYLIREGAVQAHADERYFTVENLETFFEGIVPEKAHLLIGMQVEYWARSQQKLFLAAALLDGQVPLEAAESLAGMGNIDVFFDDAVATRLFESTLRYDMIIAKHGLIVDALQEYALQNRFAAKRVAEALLPHAEHIETDYLRCNALKARLTEAAGRIEEAIPLAYETGLVLLQQHQLEQADRYLAMADRLCAVVDELTERRFEILLDLLMVRDQRYMLGAERTATALQNARLLWRAFGQISHLSVAKSKSLRLRAGYILWRAEHTQEHFAHAEKLARELTQEISGADKIPAEVAGDALSALGITLKALGRPHESQCTFRNALEKIPDSLRLRVQYHSNEASLALADAPEIALEHYDTILELTEPNGPLFLPHLHSQVDRAMALFHMRQGERALTQARRAEQMAGSNGVAAQTARALNIIGCVLWGKGAVPEAHACFYQAVLNAERSYSERFLWRMRTNLAGTALALKKTEEAAGNALSAARKILEARAGLWPNPATAYKARWYHALLQCCAILWQLGQEADVLDLAKDIEMEDFPDQVLRLANGSFEGLSGSVYAGKIMITG